MESNFMIVKISKRTAKAPEVQAVLTKYGCSIKVRLGLHEAGDVCSDEGILFLQLTGEKDEMKELEKTLKKMEGVQAKMVEL